MGSIFDFLICKYLGFGILQPDFLMVGMGVLCTHFDEVLVENTRVSDICYRLSQS